MVKKMILVILLTVLAVSLFGCSTVSGVGQDISGASNTVKGWFEK